MSEDFTTNTAASNAMLNPGKFDFADSLGHLVGNREFETGFRNFLNGQDDRTTYIWNALSAMGHDLGEITFSNIRNYIDEVSNVDTCKVKALNSMIKSFGLTYGGVGQTDRYPVEVLNLVDVFSIDPKFLLNSDKIKKDLADSIALSCGGFDTLDMDRYPVYVRDVFKDLIMSFLELRYNTSQNGIKPIYHYLENEYLLNQKYYDLYFGSSIRDFKVKNNISPFFREQEIADAIESGNDSLDEYTGAERALLELVFADRARMLTSEDVADTQVRAELKTRFSYYRKAKVLEYARFVDDMYALQTLEFKGGYAMNPNYGEVNIGSERIFNYDETPKIHEDMVDRVAESLAQTVLYIQKLRKKLKLQIRKNYMKGTMNLLTYVINEFLVDYSRTSQTFTQDISSSNNAAETLSKIRNELTSSNSRDIELIEYYDTTEYYNLQTGSSGDSVNDQTNPNFKDEYFRKTSDGVYDKDALRHGLEFSLKEIEDFYLSSLNLASNLDDSTDGFIRFLDTIYTAGADDSFLDRNGNFSYRISSDPETGVDFYTSDLYQRYVLLRDTLAKYREFLSAGDYEYPDAPISDQLSNVVDDYLYTKLSVENLSSISVVFDEFHPRYSELNDRFDNLSSRYTSFTTGDFRSYLDKTDCKYSYEDNLYGGTYKHDYYNDHYEKYNSFYLIDKLGDIRSYVEDDDNMVTHQVIDTLEYVQGELYQVSTDLMDNVGVVLEGYGYIDVKSAFMQTEMDAMTSFIDEYIELRKEAITKQIAEIRTQSGKLKETYDQLESSLDNALANYNEGHSPMGTASSNLFGKCINTRECGREKYHMKDGGSIAKIRKKYGDQIEDIVVGYLLPSREGKAVKQAVFYKLWDDDSGEYDRFTEASIDTANCAIDENDNIYEKISKATTWMHQVTSALIVTRNDDDEGGDSDLNGNCELYENSIAYGYCNPGVEAALKSIKASMSELEETYSGVVDSLQKLGYDFDASGYIGDNITELLNFLASELNEDFSLDPIISELMRCKNQIVVLRTQFTDLEHEYQTLGDFKGYNQELTDENIEIFRQVTRNVDSDNQKSLLEDINSAISEYYSIQAVYNALADEIHVKIPTYYPQASHLELELEDMLNALILDIENRRDAGTQVINARMDDMRYYVSILRNYIPDQMSSEVKFEDAIDAKVEELDYFNWDSYRENYEVFRTYSSSPVGYEPYYNHKNLTHSSYQIHPFLWRFIRTSKMKEIMSRSFDSFFNDRLEMGNIAGHIDSIIGKFGEVVNIWMNNTVDFSGYTTRYEISEHIGTNVDYSPVIDYDGAFYPPAVEEYVKNPSVAAKTVSDAMTKITFVSDCVKPNINGEVTESQLLDALSSGYQYFTEFSPRTVVGYVDQNISLSSHPHFNNIQKFLVDALPETFFEKYYSHLQIRDEDNLDRFFIASQLGSPDVSAKIFDITETKRRERDVYDIYRYGMDSFDNMYILYKRYDDENPSYWDKKNTPGQLWIRRKDHPIAFPAILPNELSGLQAIDRSVDMNAYLMLSVQDADKYCFDFEFSQNKEIMAIMARNPSLSGQVFDRYEYCDVVMSKIDYSFDSVVQKRELLKFTTDGDRFDDIIAPLDIPTEGSIRELSSGTFWSLLGTYPNQNSEIRLVYATKQLQLLSYDQVMVELPPAITARIAFFNDRTSHVLLDESTYRDFTLDTTTGGTPRIPTGQDIVFANNMEQGQENVVFAFATRKADNFTPEYNSELTVSVQEGTEGATIEDALSPEMNSLDVLDSDIMLSKIRVYSNEVRKLGDGRIYNTNADISYQPLYPGDDGQITLSSGQEYYNIELLGRSRDITKWVDAINENPNPFMELSDIVENHTFGRVYEDYQDNLSDCLLLFDNATFTENSLDVNQRPVVTEDGAFYAWTIPISNIPNAENMNIAFFNTTSLGKNPYLMCKLSDLIALSGAAVDVTYDAEGEVSEIPVLGQRIECTVVGTQRQNQTNLMDTNRLSNIRSIDIRYTDQGCIVVRMWIDEVDLPMFIAEKTLRIALYDQFNIEQFKYYHLLDAYGVVNVYQMYTNEDIYGKVLSGEGWKIIYDRKDISEDEKNRVRSAIEVDGRGRVYLQDIDLSKYSFLSSVYLFNQNKVAFKYNDEHRMPRLDAEYFYPFLNRKYPSTAAQVFDANLKFGLNTDIISDDFQIFDENNLFVVNLDEDYSVVSSLGDIRIPTYQNFDDSEEVVRVYEDFLSTFNEDGITGYNELKYDINDPHIFEFVHFCALSSRGKDISADNFGLSVDESEISGKTVSRFLEYIDSKFEDMDYIPFGQSNSAFDMSSSVVASITPENVSLSDFLKILVNYKKERDRSITLFFNYENYINTPYVRLEHGRPRSQIIDGTYLKLESGQSGILDIVVQFRYYNGDMLFGYRNVKLLSYRITNLSDDKPKFFIKKVYQVDRSDVQMDTNTYLANLKVDDVVIDCDKLILDDPAIEDQKYNFAVDIQLQTNAIMHPGSTIDVEYPTNIMTQIDGEYRGYRVDKSELGTTTVTITNRNLSSIRLYFQTTKTVMQMVQYANRAYGVEISNVNITSESGIPVYSTSIPGIVSVKNQKKYVLQSEDGQTMTDESENGKILTNY